MRCLEFFPGWCNRVENLDYKPYVPCAIVAIIISLHNFDTRLKWPHLAWLESRNDGHIITTQRCECYLSWNDYDMPVISSLILKWSFLKALCIALFAWNLVWVLICMCFFISWLHICSCIIAFGLAHVLYLDMGSWSAGALNNGVPWWDRMSSSRRPNSLH